VGKDFLKFCGQAHTRAYISLVTVVCSSLPPVLYWDRFDLHECKRSCTHSQKVWKKISFSPPVRSTVGVGKFVQKHVQTTKFRFEWQLWNVFYESTFCLFKVKPILLGPSICNPFH
jgi:hypothetical protein